MKILKTCILSALLCLSLFHGSAQERTLTVKEPNYNQPKLFNDLPNRLRLQDKDLISAMDMPVGSVIRTNIADGFLFVGTIVSRAADAHVKTIVVRSMNRQGATLTFTKTRNADGTYDYIGRIISFKNSDAYEIVQQDGQLVLQKTALYDLVSE